MSLGAMYSFNQKKLSRTSNYFHAYLIVFAIRALKIKLLH
jgi:hypothetical protein